MVEYYESELMNLIATYMWALMRVGTMLMVMPIFSAKGLPNNIKLGIIIVITAAMMPVIPKAPDINLLGLEMVLISGQQILIGAMIGMIMQMVFNAVVFGGQGISTSAGLSFASMMDPASVETVPVVAQLLVILTTLLFITIDGHHIMIEMIAESFTTLPIGLQGIARTDITDVANWVTKIFAGGVVLALPTIGAILMVNVGFGVITKASPQISIFTIGIPITIFLSFMIMWVTLPSMMNQFLNMVESAFEIIRAIIVAKQG